jgi:4-carboxymuconolactone decarboxylase
MNIPRLKVLSKEDLDEAQLKVHDAIAGGPRGGVRGPFNALLRSPELADRVQKLGEYIRFNTSLPPRLSEFAIIITGRYWGAQYEWFAHAPMAVKGGLAPEIVEDLRNGRRPKGMKEDESALYDFCMQLHETKSVSDEAYAAVVKQFGERGVVDLLGISGYYTLVSMVLNTNRQPLPEGAAPPLPPLK